MTRPREKERVFCWHLPLAVASGLSRKPPDYGDSSFRLEPEATGWKSNVAETFNKRGAMTALGANHVFVAALDK
jgi:hypothetical protein